MQPDNALISVQEFLDLVTDFRSAVIEVAAEYGVPEHEALEWFFRLVGVRRMKMNVLYTGYANWVHTVEIPDDTPESDRVQAAFDASDEAYAEDAPAGLCWSCASDFELDATAMEATDAWPADD